MNSSRRRSHQLHSMEPAHEAPLSAEITALYAIIVVLLVLGAGLMSGLTLGLLSLDVMDLEVRRGLHTSHRWRIYMYDAWI